MEHVWRGFGKEVPQLRIETNPPVALQINDHESVLEENQETANDAADVGDLDTEMVELIRRCDARIELVAAEPTRAIGVEHTGLVTWTPNLDASSPEVRRVVLFLSKHLGGIAYDNVDGEWIREGE